MGCPPGPNNPARRDPVTSGVFVMVAMTFLATGTVSAQSQRTTGDQRFQTLRTYSDEYHPWSPPLTKTAWEAEAAQLRDQILVAAGLFPLPERAPLNPVIHGRLKREGYSVEKVSFDSCPGVTVTGNLYRPLDGKGDEAPRPGVLSPHGHWPEGRFYFADDDEQRAQRESGAEPFAAGALAPIQARMVQLARLGCVVFHYDMVGYADSTTLDHRSGFNDVDAALWLHNMLGIQLWNSIRALDFLESLPDVDPQRIGVTGASGGGTQTMLLCAVDPRPAVSFPAVMVGTGMQGGCICENACYLRQGINNVAIAALFAPKPMAMSGADDWTIRLETHGLPELKQIYSFYRKADQVHAKVFPQFGHNYNNASRELMLAWFREHLGLPDRTPIPSSDFTPLTVEEMTVYNAEYPRPTDELLAADLRDQWRERDRESFERRLAGDRMQFLNVQRRALRVMIPPVTRAVRLQFEEPVKLSDDGGILMRRGEVCYDDACVQVVSVSSTVRTNGRAVIWIDGAGHSALFEDGKLIGAVRQLLDAGLTVLSADVCLTGDAATSELPFAAADLPTADFLAGYNRPLLAERVRDIAAVVTALEAEEFAGIDLVATGTTGVWGLLARAQIGRETIDRIVLDLGEFTFQSIDSVGDPEFLPGALKYGDIGGLATAAFPSRLEIFTRVGAHLKPLETVYAESPGHLRTRSAILTPDAVVEALLQPLDRGE